MIKKNVCLSAFLAIILSFSATAKQHSLASKRVNRIIHKTALQLIKKHDIPGMAIAVITKNNAYYFIYGVSDKEKNIPVTEQTLFEIGGISKTFLGVLGGDSLARGEISLKESASVYWPALNARRWKNITLLQLATYTTGGLPHAIPRYVTDIPTLLRFYNTWQPQWSPGNVRLYADSSMTLFGTLVVRPSGMPVEEALQKRILHPLKLFYTGFHVPDVALNDYAWGYRHQKAVRLLSHMPATLAYGMKSNIQDMAAWVQANMQPEHVTDNSLQQGILFAQYRYSRIGSMYQGLGWDIFNWPADCQAIMFCSNRQVSNEPRVAVNIIPPAPAVSLSWVHKTGSTRGFSSYVAFLPDKQVGIVLLANKDYPVADRIRTAYTIVKALD